MQWAPFPSLNRGEGAAPFRASGGRYVFPLSNGFRPAAFLKCEGALSDLKPFSFDPVTGLRTMYEDTEEGFQLHYSQDAGPILEANKIKQNMGREYYAKDPDMWKVAAIPIGVQMIWLTKYGVDVYNDDHWPKVRKLLNDSEWRYLKTAEVII